ncbi:DUF3150 domain-containing protein [Fontisphaera persica]|uniref:DUF3150 domain-containing protein n=1 Tax=Fontisphaera persica TaxID=2974023 RepID=UPI0024BF7555|nr:DUF3150 domain-containing protein [Fontisphaera persica]WCJ60711.1 DUF3150 domain-containing protein [Fontisphaera persica]
MQNQLLQILTREGVLVKVSIRYWRGTKKLKPEDIGLKESQVSDRLISLGHKRLLPKEALSALALVEGRAHAFVESNTFPFLNGLAHFVPNPRLQEVNQKLKELETEFWQAKKAFLDQYATLRKNASAEWRTMAKKLVADPDRLVAAIEASFPFPNRMDRYYGFDVQLFQISVPEKLGLDLVTMADQQEVMQARQKAAQEASSKIRQGVESFVSGCVSALREQTAQLCSDMLQSIQSSETGVHQKTLNRLLRFIEQFKQMNFANARVMEEMLERIRRELLTRTAEEYRDSAKARQVLVNGLTQLRQQASELARQDASELVQRFGSMGVRKFNLAA